MPPTSPSAVDVLVAVVGAVEVGVSYRKLTVVGSPTVPVLFVKVPLAVTTSPMSKVDGIVSLS
jgi:hypothetical protein